MRSTSSNETRAGISVGIAEEMGLTPKDCEALAEINEKRRKPEEALNWVERGLQLEKEKRCRTHRAMCPSLRGKPKPPAIPAVDYSDA